MQFFFFRRQKFLPPILFYFGDSFYVFLTSFFIFVFNFKNFSGFILYISIFISLAFFAISIFFLFPTLLIIAVSFLFIFSKSLILLIFTNFLSLDFLFDL